MSGKGWFWSGLALVVAGATVGLALAQGGGSDDSAPAAPEDDLSGVAAASGAQVSGWLEIPARSGVPFQRLDGADVTLRELRGRVVVLNFWGTWCPPCRREIPDLVELQAALPEELGTVIGVAIQSGSADDIRAFAGEFGINYPLWTMDSRTALTHFTAVGYPYTLLIDEDGVIRKQYLGPQAYETLARDIEHLTERDLPNPPGSRDPAEG